MFPFLSFSSFFLILFSLLIWGIMGTRVSEKTLDGRCRWLSADADTALRHELIRHP